MKKSVNWKQVFPSLLMITALVASMTIGTAYAKYVTQKQTPGTVTITADIGTIEIWETPVTYSTTAGYTPGADRQKSDSSYSYIMIPGLDIPKDPVVKITKESNLAAYVYITVNTDITSSDTGVKYTLESCWKPVEEHAGVYVYCNGEGNPIEVTTSVDISILVDNTIYVSQYLKHNVSGSCYLKFSATMRQAVEGKSAKEIYEDTTNY